MIKIEQLSHHYQNFPVLKGIDLVLRDGEIFGLLGPNGAGKSTLVNILVTRLQYCLGNIWIDGMELTQCPTEVRTMFGVVFQEISLDERLTVFENLYFHARLYHVPGREIRQRIATVLEMVDLAQRQKTLVMNLSGGMKRRLEIARAMVHQPRILFLDEPTIGLDPQTRNRIWEYLKTLRAEKGLTIFLTTHYLEEAEVCDRIAIIDRGRIIALDTPAKLKAQVGGDIITLRTADNPAVREILREGFKLEVVNEHDQLRVRVSNGELFLPRLFDTVGDKIIAVDIKKSSLEDVFIQMTGRELRDTEAGSWEGNRNAVKSRRLR